MKILLFSFFVICAVATHAQAVSRDSFSAVIVHKDPRFDEMAAKQVEINKKSYLSTSHYVRGFRVQASNTQNRDEANEVKAELLRRFPDQKSYLLYQAPSFRVRIGNFLTQKDASQLRKLVSALYPQKGVYIVPDIIEYTPTSDEGFMQDE